MSYQVPTEPQIGEMLSFNTKGFVSWLIRLFSPGVNHIETFAFNPETGNIECISARADGVTFKPVEEVVKNAKGTVYYHKLSKEAHDTIDFEKVNQCAIELDGASYDFLHLIGVGIDDVHIDWLKVFPKVPDWVIKALKTAFTNQPTKRAVVCSGVFNWLVVNYGFGLSTIDYNPSEVTPLEVCRYKIFQDYQVLKGDDKGIRDYNTVKII